MFLERIVTQTRSDLEQRKRERSLSEVQQLAATQQTPRDLLTALRGKTEMDRQESDALFCDDVLGSVGVGLRPTRSRERSESAVQPLEPAESESASCFAPGVGGPQAHPYDTRTAATKKSIAPSRQTVRLIAEVKRASPSKGMLAPHLKPVELARLYEANGAAAISVLTEPHFFLGSPQYLTAIKQAVRVPVLCKDFIIDEYQVYEARSWGADAILLICALLDDGQLRHLLSVAHTLGMRCLVETHSIAEAQRAVAAGAMIIGVNSRDLTTFEMNPYLIRDLRHLLPADRVIVAESGIHNAADARRLARYDVQAMLVGESLVVSQDVPGQMRTLLQGANESTQVKICGLRTPEHLDTAIDAGADMLGLVFYAPSHRYLTPEEASRLVQSNEHLATQKGKAAPDLVGVFVNEVADVINDIAQRVGLHFVQLHGDEAPEFCQRIQRPVIKAIPLRSADDVDKIKAYSGVAWRILLDTPSAGWGGSGVTHDWSLAQSVAQTLPILLAGGLTPENVAAAIAQIHPWGVDVSSGVETNKQKDTAKIRAFIAQARAAKP